MNPLSKEVYGTDVEVMATCIVQNLTCMNSWWFTGGSYSQTIHLH